MPILTKEFLTSIGLEMSDEDFASLSRHFETTLEDRVINEIVTYLTPEQARELLTLKDSSDDQLTQWIVDNVPDFKAIVADEIAILRGEIAEGATNL